MHRAVEGNAFQIDGNHTGASLENRVLEILTGVESNLNDLVQGLNLLGLKRCSHCKKFFRSSDPGALFAAGRELVCFECIPTWWPSRCEQLSCADRQTIEGNLVFWLRSFHDARSYSRSAKSKGTEPVKFELLANCLECRGTGMYLGDKRCRYCSGPGTIRVVVPERFLRLAPRAESQS